MTFEGVNQFKEALTRYSIMERKELRFSKNTQVYVRIRCKKLKCPWYISGTKDAKSDVFYVIAYVDNYQCNVVNKSSRLTYKRLADFILEKFDMVLAVKIIDL